MIKFKTFWPYYRCGALFSAAEWVNEWLKENPNIEIINWQTTSVGNHNELYITVQYKEN
jgi:hypothetical protein